MEFKTWIVENLKFEINKLEYHKENPSLVKTSYKENQRSMST